jgi:DNA-binding transcriptional LysR family regulator
MPSFNPNELYDLSVFLAIVRYRSFRKAADLMDVTASALSHRIRHLEERLGVRLLNRTSRSVVPTAAGIALSEKIAAGLDLIESGLDDLHGLSNGAAGSVRINVMHDAATLLISPILPILSERFPHLDVEISVDDHFVDVTAEGFDAGIRYAGTIPEDMIAAALSPPLKWVVVGSPAYLARKGRPTVPDDLVDHRCIRIRTGRGQIYKWEFERGDDRREIDAPGLFICGDTTLSMHAALAGLGLYYCLEALALPYVVEGRLAMVLEDWASIGPGYAMYYSSRHQLPLGVRALIEVIREVRPLG